MNARPPVEGSQSAKNMSSIGFRRTFEALDAAATRATIRWHCHCPTSAAVDDYDSGMPRRIGLTGMTGGFRGHYLPGLKSSSL
jgi:hypothetical protein